MAGVHLDGHGIEESNYTKASGGRVSELQKGEEAGKEKEGAYQKDKMYLLLLRSLS